MFMRNQALLHYYVKLGGGQALTYLQPFNGFGVRSMSRFDAAGLAHLRRRVSADGTTHLDAMYGFYRQVAGEFQRRRDEGYCDITTMFDEVSSDIYIDQVHCSDRGYDVIARRIARDILERESVAD
jgi:hypothetical protein